MCLRDLPYTYMKGRITRIWAAGAVKLRLNMVSTGLINTEAKGKEFVNQNMHYPRRVSSETAYGPI